jgi:hypothetical protein
MVKLKEFITLLAKKAGYDTESATAKPFFEALPDTDVPEDVGKGIDNALISLAEAKNNHADIKNHYFKQALDGMDKEFLGVMDAFELDDATRTEILGEKNTYKRGPILTRKIVELERKKISANSGKDKATIQAEIDGLHAELKSVKETLQSEKASFEQQRLQDRINNKKNVFYGGIKTIHDELDPETRLTIIDSQINKALQDAGAKFTMDDSGSVVILRNDGTNFFGENHQQVKPLQFIEQVLAKNKQIKVNDLPSNGSNGAKPQNGAQPASSGGNGTKEQQSQSAAINRNLQAMQEYENSTKAGAFGV